MVSLAVSERDGVWSRTTRGDPWYDRCTGFWKHGWRFERVVSELAPHLKVQTNSKALFTLNACVHGCFRRQERVLWQQVMVFTLNIFISKLGWQRSKKNAYADVTCECTLTKCYVKQNCLWFYAEWLNTVMRATLFYLNLTHTTEHMPKILHQCNCDL